LASLDAANNAELRQLKVDVLDRWLGAYQTGHPIIQTRDLLLDILSMIFGIQSYSATLEILSLEEGKDVG
jgi:hypothetical protein